MEPIVCELANGHTLKLVARYWWPVPTFEEMAARDWPDPYFAIRVYCTEDTLPKRLRWSHEFSEERDFDSTRIEQIWEWAKDLAAGRAIYDYDSIEEFIADFADNLAHLSDGGEDAVEHVHALPALTAPAWFDQFDDSIFNDQDDDERSG